MDGDEISLMDSAGIDTAKPTMAMTRIRPSKGLLPLGLGELWNYRELCYFLVWRDVKVRYKQTVLGALWAVLQPFLTMVVFSIFLGHFARVPSDGVPYPIFSFAALVPWTFFAHGLSQSSNSLVGSANLITKVYFPRMILPLAGVASGLVDFIIALAVLIAMMLFYGVSLGLNLLWIPVFFALAFVASLGAGMWLSALNVEYRDIRYVLPFLAQCWMFVTPIVYPMSIIPEPWRTVYGVNPMVAVAEGFRWALLGTATLTLPIVVLSSLASLAMLVGGVCYFRNTERLFADVI